MSTAAVTRADTPGPEDYRSTFVVRTSGADARRTACAVFGGAPAWFRLLLTLGWRFVLRLRLDGPVASLGWRLDGDAGTATLTAGGPWLAARDEIRVDGDAVSWTTAVDYRSPVGRLLWTLAAPVHHRTLPWLLRRAADSGSLNAGGNR